MFVLPGLLDCAIVVVHFLFIQGQHCLNVFKVIICFISIIILHIPNLKICIFHSTYWKILFDGPKKSPSSNSLATRLPTNELPAPARSLVEGNNGEVVAGSWLAEGAEAAEAAATGWAAAALTCDEAAMHAMSASLVDRLKHIQQI